MILEKDPYSIEKVLSSIKEAIEAKNEESKKKNVA